MLSALVPEDVHGALGKHLLLEGFPLVLDLERSRGSLLVDAVTGKSYLDFHTSFASSPLGFNPPGITEDPEFLKQLAAVAVNKPANCDLYTTHLAEFVATFARVLGDPDLPHLFFIEGGALAVENALKCAFDWKSRHNQEVGHPASPDLKALHLTKAFHGRSGYTMSLTNTVPEKTARFPSFDWPRIDVPAINLCEANGDDVRDAERVAVAQALRAFQLNQHKIACFIAEPIQGEGGDNHMRPEFLQAMQRMCEDFAALFLLDEVQTGVGLTGTAWAYQQMDLQPDVVAFGKKVQLGGIMAGRRVDIVRDNVFAVASRISSTWGGNLVDMVRSRRLLEIIEAEGLIARAASLGNYFLAGLRKASDRHPEISRVRGRGLMCAFDLPSEEFRDEALRRLREDEQIIMLPSGPRSIRIRPSLTVTESELNTALAALDRVLRGTQGAARNVAGWCG